MKNHTKNDFEKDMNKLWHQASNATLVMMLGSLGSFLIVFLVVFFLTRNRLDVSVVIPFALFTALIIMFVTNMIIRKLFQKRRSSHA